MLERHQDSPRSAPQPIDFFEALDEPEIEIGDLDATRNLKIRSFVSLVLNRVFGEMQSVLRYRDLGFRGITPMQYFQDFRYRTQPHGYGDKFRSRLRIRLCRSLADQRDARSGHMQRRERIVIVTTAELRSRVARADPKSLGFEPELGEDEVAGEATVLHVLTSPHAAPGERSVLTVPPELKFLKEHAFDQSFPTVEILQRVEPGYAELVPSVLPDSIGVWGLANSDVFQHVNAREYIFGMENRLSAVLHAAGLPLGRHRAVRAQVIFRRPSFVGERFRVRCQLFCRQPQTLAIGGFHRVDEAGREDATPNAVLRFEGQFE